ncbi:hypothetical protein ACQ4PT_046251 [Festuca glaucescens]
MDRPWALFKTMLSEERLAPTADVYKVLVGAHGYSGMLEEALATDPKGAAAGCKQDKYTFSFLINCCRKSCHFDLIPAVLGVMAYLGLGCNVVLHNGIIDGLGKAGKLEEMENALSNMLEGGENVPDTYAMNSIVWAYGNRGRVDDMEKWLMKIQGVKPNAITYCSVVNGYSKTGHLDMVPAIVRQTENIDVVLDTPFFNCVISAYAKSGDIKIVEEMLQLMKDKKCKPGKVIYSAMIQAYIAHGMDEAAKLLETEVERFD